MRELIKILITAISIVYCNAVDKLKIKHCLGLIVLGYILWG